MLIATTEAVMDVSSFRIGVVVMTSINSTSKSSADGSLLNDCTSSLNVQLVTFVGSLSVFHTWARHRSGHG